MKAVFIFYFLIVVVYVNCNGINLKVQDDVVNSQIFPGDLKLQEILPIIMNELSELRKEFALLKAKTSVTENELRQEVANLKAKMSISEKADELKNKRRELLLEAYEAKKADHNDSYLPKKSISRRMPMYTSCLDLELSQSSQPNGGFYLVSDSGKNEVKLVYCDFTIPPFETEYQTDIGYVDVKTVPTYFYVQRATVFRGYDDVLPFDVVLTNIGNSMDADSGVFTAPVDGIYFFSFSGTKYDSSSLTLHLQLNGNIIGSSTCVYSRYTTCSLQSTLTLKKGDRVYLFLVRGSLYSESSRKCTHFTGYLLKQTDFPLF